MTEISWKTYDSGTSDFGESQIGVVNYNRN